MRVLPHFRPETEPMIGFRVDVFVKDPGSSGHFTVFQPDFDSARQYADQSVGSAEADGTPRGGIKRLATVRPEGHMDERAPLHIVKNFAGFVF